MDIFLVTGGTGFIGSFTARKLIEEGKRVILYDIHPKVEDNLALWDIANKVSVVKGDVLDWHKLVDTVKRYGVTRIIHTASLLTDEAERNPIMATRVICEGTLNIFEVARIFDLKSVVWSSSIAVYGEPEEYPDKPLDENDPPKPYTVYGAAKLFCEYMTNWYRRNYGLNIIGLRYSVVSGPGRVRGSTAYVSRYVEQAIYERRIIVDVNPNHKIDWIYVKDVAEANVIAAYAKTSHSIFNITNMLINMTDLLNMIREVMPDVKIEYAKELKPPIYIVKKGFSNELARKELGWQPKWNLREAIIDHIITVKKFRQRMLMP